MFSDGSEGPGQGWMKVPSRWTRARQTRLPTGRDEAAWDKMSINHEKVGDGEFAGNTRPQHRHLQFWGVITARGPEGSVWLTLNRPTSQLLRTRPIDLDVLSDGSLRSSPRRSMFQTVLSILTSPKHSRSGKFSSPETFLLFQTISSPSDMLDNRQQTSWFHLPLPHPPKLHLLSSPPSSQLQVLSHSSCSSSLPQAHRGFFFL